MTITESICKYFPHHLSTCWFSWLKSRRPFIHSRLSFIQINFKKIKESLSEEETFSKEKLSEEIFIFKIFIRMWCLLSIRNLCTRWLLSIMITFISSELAIFKPSNWKEDNILLLCNNNNKMRLGWKVENCENSLKIARLFFHIMPTHTRSTRCRHDTFGIWSNNKSSLNRAHT